MKTDDIYEDIVEDVETRFDTSNYEIDRPMPIRKNKKVVGLMRDELSRQIMKKSVRLRAKKYGYLKGNNDKGKRNH